MYHSWNIRKLLRYLAFDLALILAAICFTHFGKQHFAAVNMTHAVPLPILMYHSVTELPERDFCVTPDTLEQDFQYLRSNGYEAVSAEDLIAYTNEKGDLPQKPVMITFDDGFYNNMSAALPLLEKYDMCAVISIVGMFADIIAPDSPHQEAYSYLTWEDLRQLQQSDRIELGSHTYNMHSNDTLRRGCAKNAWESEELYHETFQKDIDTLQTRFQEELQQEPYIFAYPYGFVCPESKSVLRDAGFLLTLTCLEETNQITRDPDCLYGLSRYNRPGNLSTEAFMHRALS